MPKEIRYFICEVCSRSYSTFKEAEVCEKVDKDPPNIYKLAGKNWKDRPIVKL